MVELSKDHTQKIFKKLKQNRYNKQCFDCNSKNPTWASISFGIFICLECSSIHRNMGSNISFLRSTVHDLWTWEQIKVMKAGGNQAASEFFFENGRESINEDIVSRYASKQGIQYKKILLKKVNEISQSDLNSILSDTKNHSSYDKTKLSPTKPELISLKIDTGIKVPSEEQTSPSTLLIKIPPPSPTVKAAKSIRKSPQSVIGIRTYRKPQRSNKSGITKAVEHFDFEAAEAQAKLLVNSKQNTNKKEDINIEPYDKTGFQTFSSRLEYKNFRDTDIENHKNSNFNTSSEQINGHHTLSSSHQQIEIQSALEKFKSAKSISSDEFFGLDKSNTSNLDHKLGHTIRSSEKVAFNMGYHHNSMASKNADRNINSHSKNTADWSHVQDRALNLARMFANQTSLDLGSVKNITGNAANKVKSYFGV